MLRARIANPVLPDAKHYSDIAFSTFWTVKRSHPLNTIVFDFIQNSDTELAMDTVWHRAAEYGNPNYFPGVLVSAPCGRKHNVAYCADAIPQIPSNTDRGRLLIGTPHGKAVGWMFIDRKSVLPLGWRIIEVRIWMTRSGTKAMAFQLGLLGH